MERFKQELLRIRSNKTHCNPIPEFAGCIDFEIICQDNPRIVMERVQEILSLVIAIRFHLSWPNDEFWYDVIPAWFIKQCAVEMTIEDSEKEMEEWRKLPREIQAELEEEEKWSLLEWLYWFAPGDDERQWQWAYSDIINETSFKVGIYVESWPTAYGALKWLFRAAGGIKIIEKY